MSAPPALLPRMQGPLTSSSQAIRAFRGLRTRLIANVVSGVLSGSRLRLGMVVICTAVFWAGLFFLFFGGFQFLGMYGALAGDFVEYVFSMFFLSLLVMLFFSTGIILYSGLFQRREAAFLLTLPIAPDRVFAYKFVEAIAVSSWAFLLLGSPLMVAYGISVGVPWTFYPVFFLYLFAFVLIPGSVGAIAAVGVARFFPKRQKTILALLGGATLLAGFWVVVHVWRSPGDELTSDWLDGLLGRLSFCQNPLLPSRWMSKGLVEAAKGNWNEGLFYLGVIAANAGVAYLAAAVVARDLYRSAYSRVQGERSSKRRVGGYGLDNVFHRVFAFLPRPIRLLILKDLRTFRRDPAQWSQFLIFFGLLVLYFLSIRRIGYDTQSPYWRNLISFLNLGVTALILSTFTSRFIFPLLSLEGRNFWILGLLPLSRSAILWGKFVFATGISLVATELLVVLGDLMLRLSPTMICLHMGMILILCLGLSGISVGLGARLPNLKEDDPSRIAAGFGGTLNLLVSLVYIFAIVTSIALPFCLYFRGQDDTIASSWVLKESRFQLWLGVAIATSLIIGVIGTVIPLRIGIKAFRKMEF
jgi:ABC-2 type transport system permease protein